MCSVILAGSRHMEGCWLFDAVKHGVKTSRLAAEADSRLVERSPASAGPRSTIAPAKTLNDITRARGQRPYPRNNGVVSCTAGGSGDASSIFILSPRYVSARYISPWTVGECSVQMTKQTICELLFFFNFSVSHTPLCTPPHTHTHTCKVELVGVLAECERKPLREEWICIPFSTRNKNVASSHKLGICVLR